MELSLRLNAIMQMVSPCEGAADVGCDHGYLAISLIENKLAKKVVAMDVAKGPLSRARDNIEKAGLQNQIETRLSDGVTKLVAGEVDTVIMAGIGGNLMMRLLENGKDILRTVTELVLSPQSEIEQVRRYLLSNGYIIADENMIVDEGKTYVILKVRHGAEKYEKRCQYRYGKILLEKHSDILKDSLEKEKSQLMFIQDSLEDSKTESGITRLKEIAKDLECIEEGLSYYDL